MLIFNKKNMSSERKIRITLVNECHKGANLSKNFFFNFLKKFIELSEGVFFFSKIVISFEKKRSSKKKLKEIEFYKIGYLVAK